MAKNKKLAILLRGIIEENPVLILVLGTCPSIATATSLQSAVSMGIAATIVLICSNVVISLLACVLVADVGLGVLACALDTEHLAYTEALVFDELSGAELGHTRSASGGIGRDEAAG